MRRVQLPAAAMAILFAILVATTPAAATSHLAVASVHTTTTDFNNAATLENVTVDSGTVALDLDISAVTDTFEDGDISEYSGSTSSFSVSSSGPVLEGSQTLHHDTNSFQHVISTSGLDEYPAQGDTYRWDFQSNSGAAEALVGVQDSNNYYILEASPSGDYIRIQKKNGGAINTLSTTSTTVPASTQLRGELDWGSGGELTFTVTNVDTGATVGTVTASDSAYTSGGVGWRGDTGTHYDNATINATDTGGDIGTYISATHNAGNITEGWTNLTLANAAADVTWQANTGGTWSDVASATYTTSGNRTLDLSSVDADEWRVNVTFQNQSGATTAELHDEGLLFESRQPDAALSSPPDGKQLEDSTVTLEAQVNDSDFALPQGDSVNVEFQTMGPESSTWSTAGTTTVTANGTATTDFRPDVGGEWTWRVVATDDYDEQDTTGSRTFESPAITIRNETNTSETLPDDTSVKIRIFGESEVYERTGNPINMTGIPLTSDFIIEMDPGNGYHSRTLYVKSVYEQPNAYVLDTSYASVEPTFTINDQTGEFDENSIVFIQKPINQSGTITYRTIAADTVGSDGVTETLHKDQRYRLVVENQDGDRRVLGKFNARDSNTYELNVQELVFDLSKNDTAINWGFNYTSVEDGQDTVQFRYQDPEDRTENLEVVIYERGNKSNELHNATYAGPLGSLSIIEPVPAGDANSEWVVEWNAKRGDETLGAQWAAGPLGTVPLPTSDRLVHTIAVGFILIVGGLASQVNSAAVGITVAGTAGIAWYIGFLPNAVAGGMIALAFLVPVLYLVQSEGGFS